MKKKIGLMTNSAILLMILQRKMSLKTNLVFSSSLHLHSNNKAMNFSKRILEILALKLFPALKLQELKSDHSFYLKAIKNNKRNNQKIHKKFNMMFLCKLVQIKL